MKMIRRRYLMSGIVQGVGFRPQVARVAGRWPVTGFVGNDDLRVFIEVQGDSTDLDGFIGDFLDDLPPLAKVLAIESTDIQVLPGESAFTIVQSRRESGARTLIPPDVATCRDCRADIADPENRRFGYAFTTCTNCGPRLSIIEDLPYDRPLTTMREFPMCPECAAEYSDPDDRRYHAQPISCYACGPHLWLVDANEVPAASPDPFAEDDPVPAELWDGSRGGRDLAAQEAVIAEFQHRIRAGQIVAVKGIGGFHLLCDAGNAQAVTRLRQRKHRDGKPFAVMVPDLAAARQIVQVSAAVAELLTGPEHPIVLLAKVSDSGADTGAAQECAPGLARLGVMLAYSPLHLRLLDGLGPVVATSGNFSSEPLCYENRQALARLTGIADAFVLHNRGIAVPVEDSVIQLDSAVANTVFIRRSRGYAPSPVMLPAAKHGAGVPGTKGAVVLGVGGELKNTFCLVRDGMAFVSAHIGDMGSYESQVAFDAAMRQLLGMHREQPGIVVCDAHPNYATSAWAERYVNQERSKGREVQLYRLQHHRAHALSLLAENGEHRAVIAALDGTGYGEDGQVWGSEIFTCDLDVSNPLTADSMLQRTWHLPYFPLVGGDLAVKEPWRLAALLLDTLGVKVPTDSPFKEYLDSVAGATYKTVLEQAKQPRNPVLVDSVGRYFDAASALLGICEVATYEAEPAVLLQQAAQDYLSEAPDSAPVCTAGSGDSQNRVRDLIVSLVSANSTGSAAWAFHRGMAAIIADEMIAAAHAANIDAAGITGGSAVNTVLTGMIVERLRTAGLRVLGHRQVPPNDGGLSLGQAYYGALIAMSGISGEPDAP